MKVRKGDGQRVSGLRSESGQRCCVEKIRVRVRGRVRIRVRMQVVGVTVMHRT